MNSVANILKMKRIAFYGGSFDPPHNGHLAIARSLLEKFELDEFVFIPAFHAPHKVRLTPTSAYDRYTMLCLITANEPNINVSKLEINVPERPYSVETLSRINEEMPGDEIRLRPVHLQRERTPHFVHSFSIGPHAQEHGAGAVVRGGNEDEVTAHDGRHRIHRLLARRAKPE